MQAEAFSPGHITGFAQFPITQKDPLLNGSLGAGFCINKGVKTTVNIENSNKNNYSILINGKIVNDVEVSRYVVNEYIPLMNKKYKITIEHQSGIPIGYGLGSSGAAALSLSLALNEALGTPLSHVEAAQIAHKADFTCKCGLGTVLAEFHGGFEMRLAVGAPGIGMVEKIQLSNRKVILFCIAPVSTKDFLTNKIQLINGIDGAMLTKLSKTRSIDDFMHMSLQFARSIDFMSNKCRNLIEDFLANGYMCSTAMFGETIFSIIKNNDVKDVQKIFGKYDSNMLVCDIDNDGASVC